MDVLIIEDDRDIATNLYDYLESKGHRLDRAADGITGLHLALTHDYDVIILDLGLPGMDGLSLCQKLRQEAKRDTPILILTARDTLDEKLEGFSQGADDYLVKPFALSEVEARLQALYSRYRSRVTSPIIRVGDLSFDPDTLEVKRANNTIKLPPKCLRLLETFMSRPGHVLNQADLEQAAWGEVLHNSDSLRTHIRTLRKALELEGQPDPIETLHGMGYRLKKHYAD